MDGQKPNQEIAKVTPEDAPQGRFPLPEFLFVGSYFLVGTAWILISDFVVESVIRDPHEPPTLQTLKGLNFVLTTAVLFYFVLRRSNARRRLAEEKSRASHERYELAAKATNDALWDWNLVTNQIVWSEGFSKLFGYPLEELEPTIDSWTNRLHPDDRDRAVTGIHKLIESGGRVWRDEYRFRRQDGTYAHIADRGYVMHNDAGRPVRMVGGMADISERKEAEMELRASRRQLRALSAKLEASREEERTRIAREIHDELGQLLTALKMDLSWIERKISPEGTGPDANAVEEKLAAATALADDMIVTVQRIASELRPGVLDNLGLPTALQSEATAWANRTGIPCSLSLPEPPPQMEPDTATGMFRIFQETLTNITRHANATAVSASLRVSDNEIALEVRDNGKGIRAEDLRDPKSLGLLGMKERAALLGGEISFTAPPEGGTLVRLRLPRNRGDTDFWQMI